MSRNIDTSQPLSAEDVKYLRDRDRLPAGYEDKAEETSVTPATPTTPDEDPTPSTAPDTGDGEEEGEGELGALNLEELKAIARARDLPVGGSKAELIERIENA